MIVNFSVFLVFLVPGLHRVVDRGLLALKSMGLEDLVGWSIPIWVLGSTAFATILLGWILWKARSLKSGSTLSEYVGFEAKLLVAW